MECVPTPPHHHHHHHQVLCLKVLVLVPLIKPPIRHGTGQKRLGPCINMWYMIPSDRLKFEQETKLNSPFRYFEDVISKWLKKLRYSIPLTKIVLPQTLIIILWFLPLGDHMMVTKWSLGGQNHKIMISVWGQSILVNDLLYLRLFSHLDITPSKYRNGEFNLVSCSNLCWSLRIMYNMLIHGPTRFWPLWCLIGGFIRGFNHPTWHTGLRENAFFGFQTRNLECIKEK